MAATMPTAPKDALPTSANPFPKTRSTATTTGVSRNTEHGVVVMAEGRQKQCQPEEQPVFPGRFLLSQKVIEGKHVQRHGESRDEAQMSQRMGQKQGTEPEAYPSYQAAAISLPQSPKA